MEGEGGLQRTVHDLRRSTRGHEVVLDEKTKKELFTDTFCRVCGAVLQFESHRNAHYEGKRHAQKVRLYFLNKELEEMAFKKKADQKTEHTNFHVDQQIAQDKNKFCSLCNMVFSSPVVAQSHYVGKIHAKKLKQLSGDPNEWTAEVGDSTVTVLNEEAVPPVSEQDTVMSPLLEKSNQHEANSEPTSNNNNEIDLTDPNKYCKMCCASFNNPLVAQQHYNGKKHARNELRRKMMEEMGDNGLPVESGGDGVYVCPICSITLTSIEMYQSHMQGNKHQIKENIVANLMKNTKKTYASFENELQDYIKVQKARGLEPKTQFRPEKDQQDSSEETEPAPTHPHPNPAAYKFFGHQAMPYQSYNPPHMTDPRMAGWDQAGYWQQKPKRMPLKHAPPRKHLTSDSSDTSSSDDSSDSYKKERRHKREHRSKERKHHSKSKRENGSSERKKRKIEETDSGKEDSDREKKSDGASADKSKHKKEKKKKDDLSTDKESKKHKKSKKVEDQRTEEEMLWDESILGF
ncbi:lysine-rich coiled-coil protein 1 isoform X2 [Pyxicephalus adspersus]|uniref:lysine-rich coiled-coil protein 1 isoform X2 n=1 Tax=Pyxicephalus adspersus TaxID=30357 RepID=UPI003B5A7A6B